MFPSYWKSKFPPEHIGPKLNAAWSFWCDEKGCVRPEHATVFREARDGHQALIKARLPYHVQYRVRPDKGQPELEAWLIENVSGVWRAYLGSFYFEFEEDAFAFRLTHL